MCASRGDRMISGWAAIGRPGKRRVTAGVVFIVETGGRVDELRRRLLLSVPLACDR